MIKYIIDNRTLQEYFGYDKEFKTIDEFCESLSHESNPNAKHSLRTMLSRDILADDEQKKERSWKESLL